MSYNLLVKTKIDEVEVSLDRYGDPIERLHVWFTFIKDFSGESHDLFNKQYEELIWLCQQYTSNPDPSARKAIKKQVYSCSKEIESFNLQLRRLSKVQARLEKDILNLGR